MEQIKSNGSKDGLFLRPVSGLVRVAGFWDVFIYNLGLISVGIGVIYTQSIGTAYYSNGSIPIATLLAAAALCFVVLGFLVWTVAIPRSGGIYVFLSRGGFPGFGFAVSFVETLSWLFYSAIAAKLLVSAVILPSLFLLFGEKHAATIFVASNLGQFALASLMVACGSWLLIHGTRIFLVSQRITFITAILGTAALIWVLRSPDTLAILSANISKLLQFHAPANLSLLLNSAHAAGWIGNNASSSKATIALVVWPVLPLIGAVFSIAIGGEIRNSARNQAWGMLSSLAIATALFVLVASLASHSIGNNVQGALTFLSDQNKLSLGGTVKLDPTIVLLSTLGTNNILIRVLIISGFFAWIWFWVPGLLSYGERAVLAWSLDRVAPATLGKLHRSFGTPYMAVLAVAAMTEVFLALIIWTEYFSTLVFILAGAIAWACALAFGIVFPYAKRSLFDRTNLAIYGTRGRIFMAAICGLATIAMCIIIYLLCRDPLATGDPKKGFTTIVVSFVVGYGCFRISAWRHRRAGFELSRAFDEIPVE